jgi:hypothetical protein
MMSAYVPSRSNETAGGIPMEMQAPRVTIAALGLLALTAAASPAQAESFPTKPVKIITQAPAGAVLT